MASTATPMKIVLGTMEIGRPKRETSEYDASLRMVQAFVDDSAKHGFAVSELDTAYMYADGLSETFLGKMLHGGNTKDKGGESKNDPTLVVPSGHTCLVATKANPWAKGGLSKDGLNNQLQTSLSRLATNSVDLFYLHAPDSNVDINETLDAVHQAHQKGHFKRLGLSNFPAWQVVEIYHLCKAKGMVLPTVYQGMYNALTRDVERELFPALRRCGMSFYCYNPLAGGILTGRYKFDDLENLSKSDKDDTQQVGSRFVGNSFAARYQERFWKKSYFDAIDAVKAALDKAYGADKVSLTEASLRWVIHHSRMSAKHGDGIILGASSMKHLDANLLACHQGPLDAAVVAAFQNAWDSCRPECPPYFR